HSIKYTKNYKKHHQLLAHVRLWTWICLLAPAVEQARKHGGNRGMSGGQNQGRNEYCQSSSDRNQGGASKQRCQHFRQGLPIFVTSRSSSCSVARVVDQEGGERQGEGKDESEHEEMKGGWRDGVEDNCRYNRGLRSSSIFYLL
ncbi:hypothetical protein ACR8HA_22370, partial [Salmonella enterica subsp. enterica serovar Paratyphi A]